jgi:hypothetical protein
MPAKRARGSPRFTESGTEHWLKSAAARFTVIVKLGHNRYPGFDNAKPDG